MMTADEAAELAEARREVARWRALAFQAGRETEKIRLEAAREVTRVLADRGTATCGMCQQPIRLQQDPVMWVHVGGSAVEDECGPQRAEAERHRRIVATGSEYGPVPPGPIEPLEVRRIRTGG